MTGGALYCRSDMKLKLSRLTAGNAVLRDRLGNNARDVGVHFHFLFCSFAPTGTLSSHAMATKTSLATHGKPAPAGPPNQTSVLR